MHKNAIPAVSTVQATGEVIQVAGVVPIKEEAIKIPGQATAMDDIKKISRPSGLRILFTPAVYNDKLLYCRIIFCNFQFINFQQ